MLYNIKSCFLACHLQGEDMSIKEKIKACSESVQKYIGVCTLWLLLGILTGFIGGAVGAAFSHGLTFASMFYADHSFAIFLLPAAGVLIALIYKLFGTVGSNTNTVFETVRDEKAVSPLLAPAVFLGTLLTHICGGSAGREGAALQIGGSIATVIGKLVRISDKQRHILTMCGMSALFSALFTTPVGACIFAVEVACVGRLYTAAMFPCMVSSTVAYSTARMLGVHAERYDNVVMPEFTIQSMWHVWLITISASLASILFCVLMHKTGKLFKNFIPNRYLRVTVGALIIIALTFAVRTGDYNGSGTKIIEEIFDGASVRPEAFLLKMIFTAVTMGCGFKGGEIVPTLFIGATLGGTVAAAVGFGVPFGAAVGMIAMFCGVTNCPITSIILGIELFGSEGMIYFMTAVLATHLFTGKFGLYSGQRIVFSKLDDEAVEEGTV